MSDVLLPYRGKQFITKRGTMINNTIIIFLLILYCKFNNIIKEKILTDVF